jgi:TonB family protein
MKTHFTAPSLFAFILLCSVMLSAGCSSSRTIGVDNSCQLDSCFAEAYNLFESGRYSESKSEFIKLIEHDTGAVEYYAYPFLAACYQHLDLPDSGRSVLSAGCQRLERPDSMRVNAVRERRQMKEWTKVYPQFPDVLKKEKGFVPRDQAPVILRTVRPVYPDAARRASSEGDVLVQGCVDAKGRVVSAIVLETDGEIFNEPAIEAFKQWQFTPASIKGKPASAWVTYPVRFRLINRERSKTLNPPPAPTRRR